MLAMFRFMRASFRMPKFWVAWLGLLMAVNFVAPWFFIPSVEGWAVLAAFMAGAVTLTLIHEKLGFVNLMGLGHVWWVPLLPWLAGRLELHETGDPMGVRTWMLSVIVLDALSLIIDATLVIRYLRGAREPTLKLEDPA